MLTQELAGIPRKALGELAGNLAGERSQITSRSPAYESAPHTECSGADTELKTPRLVLQARRGPRR
jgi:hypothetical protein